MSTFTTNEISQLMSALGKGEVNAIHAADLAAVLGYSSRPNQEDLRELIRQAINQGELILSSNSGYYIPASLQEIEEVLNSLERGTCDRRNSLLDSWNSKNPTNQSSLCHVDVKP